ncbi:MAG: hypothetical protein ABI193_02800 [Minicystis sp.]
MLDAPLVLDLTTLPEPLRDPIAGVSLAHYLIVEASRLDALPLPTVLTWLGLRPIAFERAEEPWSERIDEELAREGSTFDERYQHLLGQALSLWSRAIDPLDHDIEAWMTFQRHALAADDPGEMARRAGLLAGDELRLAHRWRDRLSTPEIAARAEAAWSGPLLPLPRLTLSPIVFPPALETS